MANGVERMYPMGHRELLERVAELGLMVSEVPPGVEPTRHRFIARARLMAALSATTVVVEAGARSGSMAVARRAHELGRTVGAVPGPVTSATSAEPYQLPRDGASLVAEASDLVSPRGRDGTETSQTPTAFRTSMRPSAATRSTRAHAL